MGKIPRVARAQPAGYPPAYECAVRLADGRRVAIRPIVPADAPELREAFRTADPATLRARFLGGPPRVTDALLDELTRVDYVDRFALVARAGRRRGHGVAIARYIAASPPPGTDARPAEIAVVVDPAWRRVGLATALVELLARRAVECGITSFTAMYWSANRPVAELASIGEARVLIRDGIAELTASLPPDAD